MVDWPVSRRRAIGVLGFGLAGGAVATYAGDDRNGSPVPESVDTHLVPRDEWLFVRGGLDYREHLIGESTTSLEVYAAALTSRSEAERRVLDPDELDDADQSEADPGRFDLDRDALAFVDEFDFSTGFVGIAQRGELPGGKLLRLQRWERLAADRYRATVSVDDDPAMDGGPDVAATYTLLVADADPDTPVPDDASLELAGEITDERP
jgi:hypothetical protein